MNIVPAQEIKRRGMAAVDEALAQGPVHVVKNNRPQYVVLTEDSYQELLEAQQETAGAYQGLAGRCRRRPHYPPRQRRSPHAPSGAAGRMTWAIVTTAAFDRRARKFLSRHPDLRTRLAATLAQLAADPFEPGLKLHALGGKLQGLQAVSITYSYRLTLTLQITAHEILLIDIGSHDEVYG
jgi:mRNA-degrading endonuclease YafQ of YafQ-DinJ toxin-antitoxin module/PHD/YefM family antitoxin component YafN of YafNO toxin-antitoxin module